MEASLLAAPVIFVACAYFTRAPWPRIAAALAGGGVFALLNIAADFLASEGDLWWYVDSGARWHAPLYFYAVAGLAVAGVSLIGWRAHRRFGAPGLLAFLVLFAVYGVFRDWRLSETLAKDFIGFGEGAWPWLADCAAWFVLMAVAIGVQTMLRGDPGREALARS